MQATPLYQIYADEFKTALADISREQLLKQYAAVKVSTQTVCEIWGVTPQTLTRYVNEGIIKVAGKNGRFNMFSLADVLSQNPKYKHIQ
jgi:hypothetical protein